MGVTFPCPHRTSPRGPSGRSLLLRGCLRRPRRTPSFAPMRNTEIEPAVRSGTAPARSYNSNFDSAEMLSGGAKRRPILITCVRTLPRSLCSREHFGGKLPEHLPEITGEMAQIAETAFESDLGNGSFRIPFQEHLPCTSQAHGFCKSHRRVCPRNRGACKHRRPKTVPGSLKPPGIAQPPKPPPRPARHGQGSPRRIAGVRS
ncbi:hypothetical protein ACVWW6_005752 [Bradyrhizobium sp. USDA 3311]